MPLPQWLTRVNRRVINPVQKIWAGYIPMFGILEHVGRKSGRRFRTPVGVFSTDDGVSILLTYGANRDWLKNITAAGGGRLKRYGRTFVVSDPRVVTKSEAAAEVTGWSKPLFTRIPAEQAVLLREV